MTLLISWMTIAVFFVYPLAAYSYSKMNLHVMMRFEKDNHFTRAHGAVWKHLRYYRIERMGLGYMLIPHFRRFLFCIMMVNLQKYMSIQIILMILISEFMMITVLNSLPF